MRRGAPLFIAVALVATAFAHAAGASEPEEAKISVVGGVVVIDDTATDWNTVNVYVLPHYELVVDSDAGIVLGPGCAKAPRLVYHPSFKHYDEYYTCTGWNHQTIRGTLGGSVDYVDQTDAPAGLRSEFDLGDDYDYYTGGPGVDVVHGGAGGDELNGGGGNDQLYGDADSDYYYKNDPGSDLIDGGTGGDEDDDYLDYAEAPGAISANIGPNGGSVKQGADTDMVKNVEGIYDSNFNDKFIVQGASASHMIEVGTRKGRDAVTSKGFADIYTDNAQRDQLRTHQGNGKKTPGVFDEITCTNKRPARLEVDKGLDEVEDC